MTERLKLITRIFLDTAPVIYYVEENPRYLPLVESVFNLLDSDAIVGVASSVTLAECLVMPYRLGREDVRRAFIEVLTESNTLFIPVDQTVAQKAAELRACHNLTLTDAFQVAAALLADCDAFLTNDATLHRITELDVIVLDEVEI